MLNITNYEGNACENHKIPLQIHYDKQQQIQKTSVENWRKNSEHCWWLLNAAAAVENSIVLLKNNYIELLHDLLKQVSINIAVCTESLFAIAKIWEPPKHPLMDVWINKIWYICTVEYYSSLRRNETDTCGNMNET